jgi:Spy/CpxP family protein refolding chaperone
MKKTVLAVATIVTLALAGYHAADARPGGAGAPCPNPGLGQTPPCYAQDAQTQLTDEELKARQQFFDENSELRKKIISKNAELTAVMNSETPDEKKAAQLSGELFDLQDEMRKKVQASGLAGSAGGFGCNGPCGGGMGMGMGCGAGGRHHGSGW